ncbi:MAG TPA: transglycosylase domain-containing protein [Candidatus Limnocylindrales bacterium]|nr:transglycosylase domain-containing protein [Candidatus Limnocylindrales bacterium]
MRLVTSHRRRSVAAARLRRRTLATSPLVRHSLGAKPASRSAGTTLAAVIGTVLLVVALLVTGVVGAAGFVTVASITVLSEDLPDPSGLATLTFDQPTIVYDRTGKVELARFQRSKRTVVDYRQLPPLVLDATTTAEDRTFWENDGFDVTAMVAAAVETAQGDGRGASTITQQLVRARLLPADVVEPGADVYLRKAKEVIQSARLTSAFPGQTGKQQIITAYLNQIFYGHDAYGIAAAAEVYFGVSDLAKLTPAQAALLAALPQSPSTLDPYRFAEENEDGKLELPANAPPVVRRNWILGNLSTSRWTRMTSADVQAAIAEPVILRGDQPAVWRAPHFTWQVRRQLEQILGSADAVETGGYRVITTLDWRAQQLAERNVAAAVIAPNLKRSRAERLLDNLKVPRADRRWIRALRGKDLHNAALVAMDYRTGDVRAYVGSGGYYRDSLASKRFNPKYDAAGVGTRQPGSAWKPIVYATAFERRALTPGSLLLDITTEFAPAAGWAPKDADQLDRGPVLVRNALQMSLNIPAIRALERTGNEAVAKQAAKLGIRFAGGEKAFLQAGLAGAIGTVEVRPIDLVSAYGTLANGGVRMPPRMVLEVRDRAGNTVWQAPATEGERAISAASAYLVTDILEGNTDPRQNEIWAEKLELRNGPDGRHRPAAVKTGTSNDARDLATYGYLPAPEAKDDPAWVVGVWMGNSDHSMPRAAKPATSLTAAAPLWQAFVRQLTKKDPVATFRKPKGVVTARIDAWSGGKPGPWTRDTRRELFRAGTEPGGKRQVDEPGLLYARACGTWAVDPVKAELGPRSWDDDVRDWLYRAHRGVGVGGHLDSRTAYFWGRSGWGGPLLGRCFVPRPVVRVDRGKDDKGKDDKPDPGDEDKPKDPGNPKPPDPSPAP